MFDARPLTAPQKAHLREVVSKAQEAIGPTASVMLDFSEPSPATAELRRQLNASVAAEAAGEIAHYLADFTMRAKAAGKLSPFGVVGATIWNDGCGTMTTNVRTFGSSDRPFIQAVEAAEEWLVRDEVAEVNLSLGLTADGLIKEGA